MAKDKERRMGRIMFVEQDKTAKEIALTLKVSENTVGDWREKEDWDKQRIAHKTGPEKLIKSYQSLMQTLVDNMIELEGRPIPKDPDKKEELETKKVRLADRMSKVNKSMENARSESRITMSTYLHVMDSVFKAMQVKEPKLYLQLLNFQESHLADVAQQYD